MPVLRMGTRGSALARVQSAWFADRLRERHPGLDVETTIIKTSGDTFSERINAGEALPPEAGGEAGPPDSPTTPGTAGLPPRQAPNVKAMFVKEIEAALLEDRIDFAVHSSKDLPAELPEGLGVVCFPPREDPRDAFILGPEGRSWDALPSGAAVGTASLRRSIQLRAANAGLRFSPVRGNVDTRLRKLREGQVEGLVLARAGLRRLGLEDVPHVPVPADVIVPAPGQGALAVEARLDRKETVELLAALDDAATRLEVELERRVMRELGGGCSTPLGALARASDGKVEMSLFWSDAEGRSPKRASGQAAARPEELDSLLSSLISSVRT